MKFKPLICQKEGTIRNTPFMYLLRLKIGCKVILIQNIDTPDGLTNGQLVSLLDVIKVDNMKHLKANLCLNITSTLLIC